MTTQEATRPLSAGAPGSRPPTARHTITACVVGYALNAMDALVISPAMQAGAIRDGTNADVVLIGTATLLSSAFGGWLAGALSDRFGRVPVLLYTILWVAVFTGLCGVAQDYFQLFVLRTVMGIGFGGMWAAAAVMVGEASGPAYRGWWVGFMQSGWALGWFAAIFVWPPLLHLLPSDVVWRALLGVGALPALWSIYVLWFVREESRVFADTRKNLEAAGKTADFLEIFSPTKLATTFLTCMLSIGAHGGYYVIVAWLPTLLREHKVAVAGTTWPDLFIVILGSFAGYLVSAWLSDLIGRRRNFVVFAIGAIVTVFACIRITDENIILVLAFPLGFFASGAFSGMGAFFTELFPTRMRGSGAGFAYNFGRGFAALILGFVASGGQLGPSIGVFVLTAYGLVIVAALLLPETKGRVLDTAADEAQEIVPGALQART